MTPNDQMTLMGLVMTFAGTVLIPLADLRLKHGPPADQQAFAILFFVVFTALAIAAANEEANQKAVTKPTWQQWRQCHQLPQPRF